MRNQILFNVILLFSFQLYADTEATNIVKFYPPLILESSVECQAVRISDEQVAMTEECLEAHRHKKNYNRMVLRLDNEMQGFLDIRDQHVNMPKGSYLNSVFLVDAVNENDEITNLFANKLSHFDFTGLNSPYKALFINENELIEMEVDLNTLEYPFLVTDDLTGIRLPSGTVILDKNGRIQCLLVSDGSCTTFDTDTASLIQEVQKRIHSSILKAPPDGDCCHATTSELYFNCITYCAMYPEDCIPCPSCRHKNSPPISVYSIVGMISALVTTLLALDAVYSPASVSSNMK